MSSIAFWARFFIATISDAKSGVTNRLWTPLDMLLSGFALTSILVSVIINFTLNGVLQYYLTAGMDYIGVYEVPIADATTTAAASGSAVLVLAPHQSPLVADILVPCVLVGFFTSIGSLASVSKIKSGNANPVDNESARAGVWRFFPSIGLSSIWARAFVLLFQILAVYYGTTRVLLYVSCSVGILGSTAAGVCVAPIRYYVWLRGCWAAGIAIVGWPAATVGTLMLAHLPAEAVKAFEERVNPAGAGAGAGAADITPVSRSSFDIMETRARRNGSAAAPATN